MSTQQKYKLSIIMDEYEDGYYADCLELQGVEAEGDSYEEVLEDITNAIDLRLGKYIEIDGEILQTEITDITIFKWKGKRKKEKIAIINAGGIPLNERIAPRFIENLRQWLYYGDIEIELKNLFFPNDKATFSRKGRDLIINTVKELSNRRDVIAIIIFHGFDSEFTDFDFFGRERIYSKIPREKPILIFYGLLVPYWHPMFNKYENKNFKASWIMDNRKLVGFRNRIFIKSMKQEFKRAFKHRRLTEDISDFLYNDTYKNTEDWLFDYDWERMKEKWGKFIESHCFRIENYNSRDFRDWEKYYKEKIDLIEYFSRGKSLNIRTRLFNEYKNELEYFLDGHHIDGVYKDKPAWDFFDVAVEVDFDNIGRHVVKMTFPIDLRVKDFRRIASEAFKGIRDIAELKWKRRLPYGLLKGNLKDKIERNNFIYGRYKQLKKIGMGNVNCFEKISEELDGLENKRNWHLDSSGVRRVVEKIRKGKYQLSFPKFLL